MKMRTPSKPDHSVKALGPKESSLRALFDEFYPRVFAYVASSLEDTTEVPETVAEAFAVAFREMEATNGRSFRLHLFRVAHDLVTSLVPSNSQRRNGPGQDERQLLALVFDAGLRPVEAADILRLPQPRVGELLLSGLRKLQPEIKSGVA